MKMSEQHEEQIYGEGGCFLAGTLINTPSGYKEIQNLQVGDEVYAFNPLNGKIVIDTIEQTHKHRWDDVHEVSVLRRIVFEQNIVVEITGNHWVFVGKGNGNAGEYNAFKRADELVKGDVCYDQYGCAIRVIKNVLAGRYTFVYNLETQNTHTFIANKVLVHNGGGGKKKKSHKHYEAPNTLRSMAVARVIEVISEGECVGLTDTTNPLKSIKLDDTPVMASDDTMNFTNVSVDQRYGTPDQTFLAGFPFVETEEVVGIDLFYGEPVSKVVGKEYNAARITITLPQGLYKQNTKNGDILGHNVIITIQTRESGGTWTDVIANHDINGKTMNAYERAFRVERPNAGNKDWEVRAVRVSAAPTSSAETNDTRVARLTKIQDLQLTYDDTALIGITIDAESVGNVVPRRAYDYSGLKIQIPTNYDGTAGTYSGEWDGTFKTAWSNNPAWVLYDLLTNDRYGLGLSASMIDKYSFYNAGVYNDELVNDGTGNGTFERRYRFDEQIMLRDDAFKLLQAIASTMRASLYGGAVIKLVQDRPSDPVKLITKANVINGAFDYSSTASRDRHTAVNVVYNDPTDGDLPKIITEEDDTGIDRYGYNLTEVAAFGCRSEGQARRLGRWLLDTEINCTQLVSFRVGLQGADLEPGDVFLLGDNDYTEVAMGGKVVSSTTTSITLDRDPPASRTTIDFISGDGSSVITKTISSVSGRVVSWSEAVSSKPLAGSDWIISGNIVPRQFRVVLAREVEKGIIEINAVQHDENKYARVEAGVSIPSADYFTPISTKDAPSPVSNITWKKESKELDTGVVKRYLRVSWDYEPDEYINSFIYQWRRDNNSWSKKEETSQPEVLLDGDVDGEYEIYVWAMHLNGKQSAETFSSYTLDSTTEGTFSDLPNISNLRVVDLDNSNPSDTDFYGKDCVVMWDDDTTAKPLSGAVFKDYRVIVKDTDGNTKRTEYITENQYNYTYSKNEEDFGKAERTFRIQVNKRDSFNLWTKTTLIQTFTNPKPNAPSIVVSEGYDLLWVELSPADDVRTDYGDYLIFGSQTSGFTASLDNLLYRGGSPWNSFSVDAGVKWYYKGAVTDTFWDGTIADVNVSGINSGEASSPIVFNDYKFSGLTFYKHADYTNKICWTTASVVKTGGSTNVGTTYTLNAGCADWTSGTLYLYYVEANAVIQTTTTLTDAIGDNKRILATYKGGTAITTANGDAFIDGSNIYAGTIGASQLAVGTAIITQEAQMAAATINAAAIQDGVITNAKIVDATIDTLKLKNGSVSYFWNGSNGSISSVGLSTTGGSWTATEEVSGNIGGSFTIPQPAGFSLGYEFTALIIFDYYSYSLFNWANGTHEVVEYVDLVSTTDSGHTIVLKNSDTHYNTHNYLRESTNLYAFQKTLKAGYKYNASFSLKHKMYNGSSKAATITSKVGRPWMSILVNLR